MPAIHHQPFQVRFYECDAYGQMQPINYLRRMQEAAFGASAAVGYDFARYDQLGYLWLVRETEIEYLSPLAYGDQVEIKTWVHDFRRFRSRRMYEFWDLNRGKLAAQASTDWVYVNAQNLRPAAIPEAMQLAFFPEGSPTERGARDRTSVPPEPPATAFRLHQSVAWGDIDMMWHVNNAVYLSYLQNAEIGLLAACGWPIERMQAEDARLVNRQQRLEYRLPATLNNELEITTWVSGLHPKEVQTHFQISRAGDQQVLVQAQARCQWADPQTGESIPIPRDLLTKLSAFRSS